jgi:hypothetical protein
MVVWLAGNRATVTLATQRTVARFRSVSFVKNSQCPVKTASMAKKHHSH